MTALATERHILLPWTVQEREADVLVCERGEGVYFWDQKGRKLLDWLSQIFNCNLGHGNRRVIEAIKQQAEKICCVTPSILTREREQMAEALSQRTPGDLNTAFFVNSGSEADDNAFILARMVTGRPKIFSKYRSYHGTTYGTLGVGGDPRRAAIDPGPPGTVRFGDPFCYRCEWDKTFPSCQLHCLGSLERQLTLENPNSVAAIVVEPCTGAAGGYPLPDGYLTGLRELCNKYGILLIADEVITGFGRTGEWFGVNHENVVPDMMILAKGLTSGYVPMGAVVVGSRVKEHFRTRMLPLGSTYAAHPLACAAAMACFEEYDKGLMPHAKKMGDLLFAKLQALAEKHPRVGNVRGKGLLATLELVSDRKNKTPLIPPNVDSPIPGQIKMKAWDEGLFFLCRGHCIFIAPPLIITPEQIDEGIAKLDRVLTFVDGLPLN